MSPDEVRKQFAAYAFGEPCNGEQLARAESLLGQPIPQVLRDLYLSFDGFLGPTDASFFWPLFERRPSHCALVEMNLFLRNHDTFPTALTSTCLFYGDSGTGAQWA